MNGVEFQENDPTRSLQVVSPHSFYWLIVLQMGGSCSRSFSLSSGIPQFTHDPLSRYGVNLCFLGGACFTWKTLMTPSQNCMRHPQPLTLPFGSLIYDSPWPTLLKMPPSCLNIPMKCTSFAIAAAPRNKMPCGWYPDPFQLHPHAEPSSSFCKPYPNIVISTP